MVSIIYATGGGEVELTRAFQAIVASKAQMVLFGQDSPLNDPPQEELLAKLALAARLPTMANHNEFAELGGLLAYGANSVSMAHQCATYVALILHGANPGDLPVLQAEVFDFAINLQSAKAVGLTIPASILVQGTEVIQ